MKSKRRPHISEEKIIEASWKLLNSEGIEQFTMRKLAIELNIQAPTIYWYFNNKQNLFQALANEVAREIINDLPKTGTWREQLFLSTQVIRQKLKKFPCSAQILLKSRPESDYLKLVDCLLQMIDTTNLSDEQKFSYVSLVFNFVIHYAIDEYEQRMVNMMLEGESNSEINLSQLSLIKRMHDAQLFNLIGSDEMFESGIALLLDGIEKREIDSSLGTV
ncbi:TetR/AcrR family transcriptional regulator C-terminal domain-containing protein [Bacillus cereus group sp. Bc256]|uniref:TetR/AcrR family transcriptional regulator C-terminal domain-containing protein n=1 Tax=unclassified Bacillus cereus group TaxID=2750818 RepID=UPI001F5848FA|nr:MULTISPECIES: TetR/AcrR family transcriptional regulator C-terminal domain-containing protein [unclassified Bacillus cereus group]MDA2139079.1 TetR/AcrR family transcriptional regulator C-terminal domain-containing protein [Bacillus cereus group sp. Bc256]MDA2598473.1 TetR/AcrR family transcriptional regulator C-terminal domain-containing protein [Bacillus cereus group sp. Bc061]